MKISLNTKAITDEMMALTALRRVTAPAAAGGGLLTRDDLPGLRVVMRMVFAELLLALGDDVAECAIDDEDPVAPLPYNDDFELQLEVELRDREEPFSSGMLLVMKRQMEHIVAAGTLGLVATRSDSELAAMLQAQREGALEALLGKLREGDGAFRRSGWPG